MQGRHGDHRITTLLQDQFRVHINLSQQAINLSSPCRFYGQLHALFTPVSSAIRKPSTFQTGSSLVEALTATQVTEKAKNLTSKARTRPPTTSISVRRCQNKATTVAATQSKAQEKAKRSLSQRSLADNLIPVRLILRTEVRRAGPSQQKVCRRRS